LGAGVGALVELADFFEALELLLGMAGDPVLLLRISVAGRFTGSLFLSAASSSSAVVTFSR
jgi:hypothetical protein